MRLDLEFISRDNAKDKPQISDRLYYLIFYKPFKHLSNYKSFKLNEKELNMIGQYM